MNDSLSEEARDCSTSLEMTNAGVANPAVVDAFGVDRKSGEILLVMNEPRPWHGGDDQLHQVQEKFNAYASFILDGEMLNAYPELGGKTARIHVRCRYMPSEAALKLFEAVHDQLEMQGIAVEVVVYGRPDGACTCAGERL